VLGRGLGLDLRGGGGCFEPEPVSVRAPNIVVVVLTVPPQHLWSDHTRLSGILRVRVRVQYYISTAPHRHLYLPLLYYHYRLTPMKVNVSREELEGFDRATIRGSIEGIAGALALSLPASFAAQRYWPAYRALPIQLKALGVILVVGPAWAIQTERRGVEFDEQHNWWVL
jgi:hypothetical protein